jgi:hypothetical protein
MSTDTLERAPVSHLNVVLGATANVLNALDSMVSCRFGPAELIEAAVVDLSAAMSALDRLGPAGGHPRLREMESTGSDTDRSICALIRTNVARISEESAGLSLELRRMLADTRDVISIATGSAGTYDALGRTMSGQVRRTRGTM